MRFMTRGFLLLLAMCTMCFPAYAGDELDWEPEYVDGLEVLYGSQYAYTLKDGQATIIGYIGSVYGWERGHLFSGEEEPASGDDDGTVIPDHLAGYPIVAIYNYAFYESMFTGVTLPEGLASIGNAAFACSYYFDTIIIPGGVISIGNGAFSSCISLDSVTLPESVTSIGEDAFWNCGTSKKTESGWEFYEESHLVLSVAEGSYAEQYARDNGIAYVFIE